MKKRLVFICSLLCIVFGLYAAIQAKDSKSNNATQSKTYRISGNYKNLGLKDGETVTVYYDDAKNLTFEHPNLTCHSAKCCQSNSNYMHENFWWRTYSVGNETVEIGFWAKGTSNNCKELTYYLEVGYSCSLSEE